MRPIILFVLLPVLFIGFALHASAQSTPTCNGSLGDPVINQDFGSGPNPGPPLANGITNMIYTNSNCPNDGYYTIANSLTGSGNCHPDTWQNVTSDHTGNPNGYMMIVNASVSPSIFFTQSAPVLCPGTTYQFSAYILNLITLAASGPGVSEPNITFSVLTTDGKVLAIDSTGTIEPTAGPTWVQKSLFFTTPDSVTSVVVQMTNNAPGGNGNDLILDDITFRACGPVIEAGFGSISGTTDQPLCQGESATYTLKAQVESSTTPTLQWQQNPGSGWQDINQQTGDTLVIPFTNAIPGAYQYRLGVGNGSASCRTYSSPLTVNVYANPVVGGVNPTQSVCAGDSLVLSASGGVSYQWSGPNLPATNQNPVTIKNLSPANSGNYKVVVSGQYCSVSDSTQVTVYTKPVVALTNNGVTICSTDSIQLGASGGTSYSWSPGKTLSDSTSANPIAKPTDTTAYIVKAYNNNGCYTADTLTINVLKKAIANAGPNRVIFEGQSVKLNGSEKYGNIFYWTPTTALSDPNSLTPMADPTDDITYTLHVTSTNNCGIDSSSVFVKVYKKITIPNTFSPNNDGINDYWDIDALITYPDCVLAVFNRYGQQVYHSIGYNKPWNGKYNGEFLPAGTYYYVLDLKNNTPKISGWVLIVR